MTEGARGTVGAGYIRNRITDEIADVNEMAENDAYIRWFEDLRSNDTAEVGGKNASLGEMKVMAENGLERGRSGLKVYVMAEIPSNVLEAPAFAERFDGFSIGTNDLTQLTLGVGRDAEKLSYLFDERSPSVKRMIRMLIDQAHDAGSKVGLCGQAPSDYAEFAAFLVEVGIDSILLNPDSVLDVIRHVAKAEKQENR